MTSDPVLTREAWQCRAGAFIRDGTLAPAVNFTPPVAVFPSHSVPMVEVISTPVSYMGIRRVGSGFR